MSERPAETDALPRTRLGPNLQPPSATANTAWFWIGAFTSTTARGWQTLAQAWVSTP